MFSMKPEPDDTTINLPITFDYSGGRGDNKKGDILASIVLTVLFLLFFIGTIRNNEKEWYMKIVICLAIFIAYSMFIRFKIFREKTYSDAYESLKEINFTPSTDSYWGIYEIDLFYPYICHFKDGKKGVYLKLEKDVVVGKPETIMFDHFDGISDAYNLAGSLNINLCHIDYMDNVGNDSRILGLYNELENCENADLRDIMLSIYSNLQVEMSHDYASFDVYLLTTRGRVDQLWYNVQMICDRFLRGNYLSYKILDLEGVRSTCMAVLNLKEFSAVEACENIFKGNSHRGIVPIKVEHLDGEITIINKTQKQIAEDNIAKAEEELKLRESKNKSKKSKPTNKTEVVKDFDSIRKDLGGITDADTTSNNSTVPTINAGSLKVIQSEEVDNSEDLKLF